MRHPLFPRLVQANFDSLRIGQLPSQVETLNQHHARYLSSLEASVRCIPYLEGNEAEDDDLDDFMLNYCSILESYHEETQTLLKQAVTNLDFFEQKLFKLQNFGATKLQTCCGSSDTAPSGVEAPEGQTIGNYGVSIYDDVQSSLTRNRTTKSVVDELQDKILTPEEEYQILHQLKAEHHRAIFDLKDEFLKRKKKGKLPQDAAAALKEWWQQNFVWPYPSDDDKKALADSTSLSLTQVNNWFINQRKRHWLKLFPSRPPTCRDEAKLRLLQQYGTLENVLRKMGIEHE
ncbi:hypothetical protein CYMTET_20734 [Cymbomonas tetramitiformis]|uniref:Homeobox domain-containing protein n=1 Tax=Cymbomonas tetramitiformis TaxID=36881 RepID=A0AAE0L3Y7_9CHLO|nr:hypothetical protein CYMTET_20734 [Cymbomonas tetramitiformis]